MNINPHSLSFPAAAGASGERNTATTESRAGEVLTSVVFDTADKVAISVPGTEAAEKSKNEEKEKEDKEKRANTINVDDEDLSDAEQREVEELKMRDKEVKQHEAAHLAAVGHFATGAPHYEWKQGPDGEKYAVGGEVGIDISRVQGDPEATIQKMEQVEQAAMAPASPSSQDYRIAAKAKDIANSARAELAKEKEEKNTSVADREASSAPDTVFPKENRRTISYYNMQVPNLSKSSLNIAV